VLRIREVRMGMVEDQSGKVHSITKVQPVPAATQSSTTLRMERGTLGFRKARSDAAGRAFIRGRVVPALRNQPEKMMNARVLFPLLGLDTGGRESRVLKPNQQIFEKHIGGGQSFKSQRIFDTVWPDMFQVRVYSQNTRLIKLISAALPDAETDPPEKNEVTGLTHDDLIREIFSGYTEEIKREIRDNHAGEWTLGRLGIWLTERNDWEARVEVASMGKTRVTTRILRALGFHVTGDAGPGAKVRNP
jgi:hypothetical protein